MNIWHTSIFPDVTLALTVPFSASQSDFWIMSSGGSLRGDDPDQEEDFILFYFILRDGNGVEAEMEGGLNHVFCSCLSLIRLCLQLRGRRFNKYWTVGGEWEKNEHFLPLFKVFFQSLVWKVWLAPSVDTLGGLNPLNLLTRGAAVAADDWILVPNPITAHPEFICSFGWRHASIRKWGTSELAADWLNASYWKTTKMQLLNQPQHKTKSNYHRYYFVGGKSNLLIK